MLVNVVTALCLALGLLQRPNIGVTDTIIKRRPQNVRSSLYFVLLANQMGVSSIDFQNNPSVFANNLCNI